MHSSGHGFPKQTSFRNSKAVIRAHVYLFKCCPPPYTQSWVQDQITSHNNPYHSFWQHAGSVEVVAVRVTAVTRALLYNVRERASWKWVTWLHLRMQSTWQGGNWALRLVPPSTSHPPLFVFFFFSRAFPVGPRACFNLSLPRLLRLFGDPK